MGWSLGREPRKDEIAEVASWGETGPGFADLGGSQPPPGGAALKRTGTSAGTSFLQLDGMVCPVNCTGVPPGRWSQPLGSCDHAFLPGRTQPPLPPRRPWGPAVTSAPPPTRCVPAPGPLGWPQSAVLLTLWLSRSWREEGAPHRPYWVPLESGQQPLVTSRAWFLGGKGGVVEPRRREGRVLSVSLERIKNVLISRPSWSCMGCSLLLGDRD